MTSPQGTPARPRRTRVHHLQEMKARGERWPMLTAYDVNTARIFDEAGVPVLLVGDSAGNTVLGYDTTVPVTIDELIPLARAVATSVRRAFVVADLPFGSYEVSPEEALHSSFRFMKETGVHAVKLEGGVRSASQIRRVVEAGVPVMGHIGFTPQSEHGLGGHLIQGRGDQIEQLLADAHAVEDAGAFAVVLEMVPAGAARRVTEELRIPTIGVGAGPHTDGQLLVWTDWAGFTKGRIPKFVKQYADLRGVLTDAVTAYRADVEGGSYPGPEHSYDD